MNAFQLHRNTLVSITTGSFSCCIETDSNSLPLLSMGPLTLYTSLPQDLQFSKLRFHFKVGTDGLALGSAQFPIPLDAQLLYSALSSESEDSAPANPVVSQGTGIAFFEDTAALGSKSSYSSAQSYGLLNPDSQMLSASLSRRKQLITMNSAWVFIFLLTVFLAYLAGRRSSV